MKTRNLRRLCLLGTLLVLGTVYATAPFQLGVVVGDSMSPSMEHGAFYVLERTERDMSNLDSGDVVVFEHDGTTYLKRVLAMPGDTIYVLTFPGSGRDEFVMDWELARMRRVVDPKRGSYAGKIVSRRVPEGFFYAVGDHMNASVDSRELGPIQAQNIVGKLSNPPNALPMLSHVAGAYRSAVDQDRS